MGRGQRNYAVLLSFISLLFKLLLFHCCAATNNITLSRPLSQNQILTSPGQVFELGFFQPNTSANRYVGIWYKDVAPRRILWVANREKPVTGSSASLTIGSDGNLKLVDGNQETLWSTNVSVPSNSSVAELSDNGNFQLKDGIAGSNLWQSFEHPSDTILLGASVGYNFKTGERRVLTSWKSDSDPSPGNFVFGLLSGSPVQAFVWKDLLPYWRSGQWDKNKFIGIPEMDSTSKSEFHLREDLEQGTLYLYVDTDNQSLALNLVISSDGTFQLIYKLKGQGWNVYWEVPKNPCDVYGVCGSFGVCDASESPICRCIRGFKPKSDQEWSKGNWTGGCVRQTKLLCEANTSATPANNGKIDKFWRMDRMKLPDFSEYLNIKTELCQEWCLNNCSCIGYAIVYGIGCLAWSGNIIDTQKFPIGGNEFFLRLAHTEFVSADESLRKKLIISLTTISCVIILGILVYGLHRKRSHKLGERREALHESDFADAINPLRETFKGIAGSNTIKQKESLIFDFKDVVISTNNFSLTNKLGEGGFGPVYKGKLQSGKEIAVKRLSSHSGQGMEEFKNEIVFISKLQHRNLVRLLGCCVEGEEKLLIYEYMPNKSLDTFLFDPTRKTQLNWGKRFSIIQGIAKGLVYLHRDSFLRVIHRDLKASNVLLDEDLNPKISDFGLARTFHETQDLTKTRRVVGTLGYMSPEYVTGGRFSEKSDVFSFGVLLLEIVSGERNSVFQNCDHLHLIGYAWRLWCEDKALNLIDQALGDSFFHVEGMRCIHVGLLCVQENPADRPNMPDVILQLTGGTNLPQPKQPAFAFASWRYSSHESNSNGNKYSMNEVTFSGIEGR